MQLHNNTAYFKVKSMDGSKVVNKEVHFSFIFWDSLEKSKYSGFINSFVKSNYAPPRISRC